MTLSIPSNRLTLAHEIRDTTTDVDARSTDEGTCARALLTPWGGMSGLKSVIPRHERRYLWKIAPLYPCGREFTLHPNELITWGRYKTESYLYSPVHNCLKFSAVLVERAR